MRLWLSNIARFSYLLFRLSLIIWLPSRADCSRKENWTIWPFWRSTVSINCYRLVFTTNILSRSQKLSGTRTTRNKEGTMIASPNSMSLTSSTSIWNPSTSTFIGTPCLSKSSLKWKTVFFLPNRWSTSPYCSFTSTSRSPTTTKKRLKCSWWYLMPGILSSLLTKRQVRW